MRPGRPFCAVALAALALAAACGARSSMTPVGPPGSWRDDLEGLRAARDAAFRTDPDSPIPAGSRATFHGLDYFPPDPSWRYAGFVEMYAAPEKLTLVTTAGKPRPCARVGRVTFARDGRPMALQVYRLLDMPERAGGEGLFLPFKDRTTGKETYPAGRYVDLEGPEGGPFVLDFNRAYDPSCAYGDAARFECPVTPQENLLPVRVAAGERGPWAHGPTADTR